MLDRPTTPRHLMRCILLFLAPSYTILALVQAGVRPIGGSLAFVGWIPTWISAMLSFQLIRQRPEGRTAKLARKPVSLALTDLALGFAFAGGIVAAIFSILIKGTRDTDGVVVGVLAATFLCLGLIIHSAFFADALRALAAHVDSRAPHCAECGSRVKLQRHAVPVQTQYERHQQDVIPAWAGKGAARGVYDVYEALLAEQGTDSSDDETEVGERKSEDVRRECGE
ncbi:MAG: hypothetical protein M1828_002611 [Chrysothrix sp. TS-e1954]|nr:MAG: hypothetical protein M1828_002611 [Chrysothrix sp. TS-e1954]